MIVERAFRTRLSAIQKVLRAEPAPARFVGGPARGNRRRILALLMRATISREPTSRHMLFGSYFSPYSADNALAISIPTRAGCSAARLVTTMNTPWHSSLAYLLDFGVKVIG